MESPPDLTLPSELLAKIFVECIPHKDSDRLNPANAPMLLCQVNSAWRQVALAETRLWDTVIFPSAQTSNPRITHRQCVRFIEDGGVERWFDRTGTSRLLSFGEEPAPNLVASVLITFFLPIVSKYARRFKHLSVAITKIRQIEFLRRGFPYDIFDELQSISICCPLELAPNEIEGFPRLNTPFNTAPKLRDVSLTLLRASPRKFVLPWTQLTNVKVDHPDKPLDLSEWKLLFLACPNIHHGTFMRPSPRDMPEGPDLIYPSLTSLTLTVLPYHWDQPPVNGSWDILVKPVNFTKLIHLHVKLTMRSRSRALLKSRRLLKTLQTLTITSEDLPFHVPFEVDDLVEDLVMHPGALPSLTRLTIPYRNFRLHDIVRLIRAHPPTSHYPGLTVAVNVVLNGMQDVYEPITTNYPDVGTRFRLVGFMVAPVNRSEEWDDADG